MLAKFLISEFFSRGKVIKGQVISGSFGEVKARLKAGSEVEIGELVVAETPHGKALMQVFNLAYSSQISEQNLELISGMKLEEGVEPSFEEENIRNYTLAFLKNLLTVKGDKAYSSKTLPEFFSLIRSVKEEDFAFLKPPRNPLFFGHLRSGRDVLVPVYLRGDLVLSHHLLITGTTGKGKSVLMSNLLWDLTGKDYAAAMVLDPHDEYYGRNKPGLKDHPARDKVAYYTAQQPVPGSISLKINVKVLRPEHFAFLGLSSPQVQAMNAFYKEYGDSWVEAVLLEKPVKLEFQDATLGVLKRRLSSLLDISTYQGLECRGVFELERGESTIPSVLDSLEQGKTVIIDTSSFSGQLELLIGSIVAGELFKRYRYYKMKGLLARKPVVTIVLEEAPRVLGKEVLEKGSNVFSSIAREGRKFKIGITAITQMPSLIPREILANMNTKVVLGTEMSTERRAIIESAAQDLSSDDKNIASLDKGEAIVTSNFSRFAVPLKIPFFDDLVKKKEKRDFAGIKLS